MIRRRQSQQHHCSVCAGDLGCRPRLDGARRFALGHAKLLSRASAQQRAGGLAQQRAATERSKPVRLGVRDHHTRSPCAESKNAANLAKSLQVIVNMFDDVRRKYQIKTAVGKRHAAYITELHEPEALFLAVMNGFLAEIQSIEGAETQVPQQPEIGAGRGPNIEDSARARQPGLFDLPREETTTAPEPPMGGFCLG